MTTTERNERMAPDTIDPSPLTKKELERLANACGVEGVDYKKNKTDIVKALRDGGVTDEQFKVALIAGEHIEPDDEQAAKDAEDDKAAKAALKAASKPAPKSTDEVDLDEWDPDDDDEHEPLEQAAALPELTEDDAPLLQELGARVRRIKKIQRHPGQMGETWHCPWTDHSRLTGPLDKGADKIPQSGAIRLGRFAAILPPTGIDAAKLERLRKRKR